MATLQKSILLNAGETDNVSLDVVFQVPQFRYFTNQQAPTNESGKVNVFREKTGYVSLRTQIAAGAKKYFIDVPAIGTVIEENDNNSLYVQYHQQLSNEREIVLVSSHSHLMMDLTHAGRRRYSTSSNRKTFRQPSSLSARTDKLTPICCAALSMKVIKSVTTHSPIPILVKYL